MPPVDPRGTFIRPGADAKERTAMLDEAEREVTIEGATGRLLGRLRSPESAAWGAIVLAHGRHETTDGPQTGPRPQPS